MSSAHVRQFPQPDDMQTGGGNSSVVTLQASERLLSPQEVVDPLDVSERWVRDYATRRDTRIRAAKLGLLLRFPWSDIEDFLSNQLLENSSKKSGRDVRTVLFSATISERL